MVNFNKLENVEKKDYELTFGERLGKFVKYVGVPNKKFAQTIGLSPQVVGRYINGVNMPKMEHLLEISKVYSKRLNFHWLITGHGEMLLSKDKPLPLTEQQLSKLAQKLHELIKEKE